MSSENNNRHQAQLDPQPEQLACPRCDSTDTKFCYYNNYNLSQPRHYCKSCKRHWTRGGSIRNVPVGGSKRSRTPPSDSAPEEPTRPDPVSNAHPPTIDLNLNHNVYEEASQDCETWRVDGGDRYVGY